MNVDKDSEALGTHNDKRTNTHTRTHKHTHTHAQVRVRVCVNIDSLTFTIDCHQMDSQINVLVTTPERPFFTLRDSGSALPFPYMKDEMGEEGKRGNGRVRKEGRKEWRKEGRKKEERKEMEGKGDEGKRGEKREES